MSLEFTVTNVCYRCRDPLSDRYPYHTCSRCLAAENYYRERVKSLSTLIRLTGLDGRLAVTGCGLETSSELSIVLYTP
jgi:hypothetical protein